MQYTDLCHLIRNATHESRRKSETNAAKLRSLLGRRRHDCSIRSTWAACRPAPCGAIEGKFARLMERSTIHGYILSTKRSTSISNVAYSGTPLTRRSSERELSDVPKKRATSAGGLDRSEGMLYDFIRTSTSLQFSI